MVVIKLDREFCCFLIPNVAVAPVAARVIERSSNTLFFIWRYALANEIVYTKALGGRIFIVIPIEEL